MAQATYKTTETEVLGLMMSQHFQWNGIAIMEAAAAGLEDANFHGECELVLGLINAVKQKRTQRQ